MKKSKKLISLLTLIVWSLFSLQSYSFSNEWKPSKPVSIMLPYGPGGTAGAISNTIKDELSKCLGQTVELESTKGAAGIIGTVQIAKSQPDGYKMLIGTPSNMAFNHVFVKEPGYDPSKDFDGVTIIGNLPKALFVKADSKYKNFQDLLNNVKSNPGKLNYGTILNTNDHLYSAVLIEQTKMKINHIPYSKSEEYLGDLLGGRIEFAMDNIPFIKTQVDNGNVRLLAVSSPVRLKEYPDVPTWGELGIPDINIPTWYGIMVPKGTPKDRVNVLNKAFVCALKEPKVIENLNKLSVTVVASNPEYTTGLIEKTAKLALNMGKLAKIEAVEVK